MTTQPPGRSAKHRFAAARVQHLGRRRIALGELRVRAAELAADLEEFPSLVEDFLRFTGKTQTSFGAHAAHSADFVRLLRSGRDFRMSSVRKVLGYIATVPGAPPRRPVRSMRRPPRWEIELIG